MRVFVRACVCACVQCVVARARVCRRLNISGMAQTVYSTTQEDFMQPLKRKSPETNKFSNCIAVQHALRRKKEVTPIITGNFYLKAKLTCIQ